MDDLQKQFAEFIKQECMTDDPEADHGKADNAVIEFLRCMGCKELMEAWKKVEKLYA